MSWTVRFVVLTWAVVSVLAAQEALREAAEALEKNDFAAAVPHLVAAIAEDAENVNARFNLAYSYTQTGNEAGAIEQYQAIVERQPEQLTARQNLAMLLMRNGRPAEAVDDFAALAAAQPEDPKIHLAWADALEKAGDLAGTLTPYEKVVALDGDSVDGLLGLGYALARLERFSEAVPYYLRAAKIRPEVEQMTLQLANLMEQAGQQSDALELYRRYARGHPDQPAVQERIGMILLERKRYPQAVEALEKAVAADPTAANRAALAEAYSQTGNSEALFAQLREAVIAEPKSPELRIRYANALLAKSEFVEASQQYLAAVENDARQVKGWNGLAFTMFQLENYPAALKALEHSAKLETPLPANRYLAALSLDKLQRYEEAQAAYQAFLASNPQMEDEEWKAGERLKVIAKVLAKR